MALLPGSCQFLGSLLRASCTAWVTKATGPLDALRVSTPAHRLRSPWVLKSHDGSTQLWDRWKRTKNKWLLRWYAHAKSWPGITGGIDALNAHDWVTRKLEKHDQSHTSGAQFLDAEMQQPRWKDCWFYLNGTVLSPMSICTLNLVVSGC